MSKWREIQKKSFKRLFLWKMVSIYNNYRLSLYISSSSSTTSSETPSHSHFVQMILLRMFLFEKETNQKLVGMMWCIWCLNKKVSSQSQRMWAPWRDATGTPIGDEMLLMLMEMEVCNGKKSKSVYKCCSWNMQLSHNLSLGLSLLFSKRNSNCNHNLMWYLTNELTSTLAFIIHT